MHGRSSNLSRDVIEVLKLSKCIFISLNMSGGVKLVPKVVRCISDHQTYH